MDMNQRCHMAVYTCHLSSCRVVSYVTLFFAATLQPHSSRNTLKLLVYARPVLPEKEGKKKYANSPHLSPRTTLYKH
ncbi:hypothetical protein XSR1_140085 [Xenorhabdus szentirmaii DSM 16338]|uniref:Uncharacterized protein n=2 Tax=Xenorhabdus szentirmaii TaxID=290112 RepID=W1IUV7_9GAMM|nr:hypothetical protein [Xenorhabdus sp. M]CDL81623.1 hypothetical protein XSR1_140085 [Xenorhabdus szentirmaii DSM 16338]